MCKTYLATSYVLATSEGQVLLQICSCLGVGQIDRLSLMCILDGDEVGDVSPVVLISDIGVDSPVTVYER